jgi:hypothetical protein
MQAERAALSVTLNWFQGSWCITGGARDAGVSPWMLNQVQHDGFGAGGSL